MSARHNAFGLSAVLAIALSAWVFAGQPPAAPKGKTPPATGSTPAANPATPRAATPAPSPEDAAREKIFASERWKKVEVEYSKWLSSQAIYTPDQVNRMGEKMIREMKTMPPDELEGFLDDWDAKLKVLLGKDFQDAQDWLGLYMTNMADGYRRNYLKKLGLTDISNLTASQLEDKIDEIRAEQVSIKQGQTAFDRSRQEMLNVSKQEIAASQRSQSQDNALRNSDSSVSPYQSSYRPIPKDVGRSQRMQFYVGSDGQIGYALPL